MTERRLIDEYLAELAGELTVTWRARRRILREIEAHLVEAADETDEQTAIAQLGPPDVVARRFAAENAPASRGTHIVLGAVGLTALAGIAAAVIVLALGSSTRDKLPIKGQAISQLYSGRPELLRQLVPRLPSFDPATVRVVAQSPTLNLAGQGARLLLLTGSEKSDGTLFLGPALVLGRELAFTSFAPIDAQRPFVWHGHVVEDWMEASQSLRRGRAVDFRAIGGTRNRDARRWVSLIGLAREDVAHVVVTLANGRHRVLPIGASHGFWYTSSSPATFPTAVYAFSTDGRLRRRIIATGLSILCTEKGTPCQLISYHGSVGRMDQIYWYTGAHPSQQVVRNGNTITWTDVAG